MKVSIKDKYVAEASFCESSSKCDKTQVIKGKWSTIYDQALKIELDNGLRFISNFRYNVKPTLSPEPLKD